MQAKIIHLSDLHFQNDAANRKRLDYLKSDLERISGGGAIYTAFTGDLVNAGDRSDDYDVLFDELFVPLSEMGHEVLVVPGNHDVQRSKTSEAFTDRHLSDAHSSYLFDQSLELLEPKFSPNTDPLTNYRSLESVLGTYDRQTYYGYSRTLGSLSFVGMNSSWLCRKRPVGESDRGKLRLEPFVLEKLSDNLPAETTKVALFHHPIDWLEETTRDAVSSLLTERFDLVLFGHVHASDMTNLARNGSGCVFLQSPPLHARWSKGTNGYSIISVNLEHKMFEVEYRSYSETRRQFVLGEDLAPNGILRPRPEDSNFFSKSPSTDGLLLRYKDGGAFDYTDWYRSNIRAKSKAVSNFVDPKARRLGADQENTELEPALPVTKIVSASLRHQYFVAPLDSGLTTAAFLTFKNLSETFSTARKIPAFFDAKERKIDKASILREITRTTLVRFSHTEAETLAENGSIVVIVDGLSMADVERFNLFRDVAEKYFPNVRFIHFLSTEHRGAPKFGNLIPNLNFEMDEVYEFAELEVGDIREMATIQVAKPENYSIDAIVSQVVHSFKQMDEPVFASSVAVVIETLNQDPEFRPINKARLLERYVECLLGRFDLDDVREGTFTSSDKIDLLSFIARKMLEEDAQRISETTWEEICESYRDNYLVELPKGLLDEFIEKGIITIFEGELTFRGDYLFSFFVARQMKSDPKFSEDMTSGEALFKYHREIAFYGDLEGTETLTVLQSIHSALESLEAILHDIYIGAGINLATEWDVACNEAGHGKKAVSEFTKATDELTDADATPESADRHDNDQLSQISRRRGVARRLEVREAEAKILVAISLYAALLKNSLQTPADQKLRHLKKLFGSAELWVGFLCALRQDIISHPVVVAGGVQIINRRALTDREKSAREFKYNAPNSMSRVLAEALRNPQLAIALRKVLPDLSNMGALFARDVLLGLPSNENREAYLNSLHREENVNLTTASLFTLRRNYLSSGRSEEHKTQIQFIVDKLSRLSSSNKSIDFAKLKKARMLRDMRERASRTPKI